MDHLERLRAANEIVSGRRVNLGKPGGRRIWFSLKKTNRYGTGCNVYFDDIGNAFIEGNKKPFLIHDPFLADGIITLFLYREQVKDMLEKPENEDLGPRCVHPQ